MASKKTPKKPNYERIIGGAIAIILVNLVVIFVGWWLDVPALAVASVSIITFFGTLSLADYATKQLGYSKGEMRTAITASILITYFVILAYTTFLKTPPDIELAKIVITNFGHVVWIVLGFYFGTEIAEIIRGKKK